MCQGATSRQGRPVVVEGGIVWGKGHPVECSGRGRTLGRSTRAVTAPWDRSGSRGCKYPRDRSAWTGYKCRLGGPLPGRSAPTCECLAVLIDAGVVDSGAALGAAAQRGTEAEVSYLLKRDQESKEPRGIPYVDSRASQMYGPPLFACIWGCRPCSPRIARLLVDAGADSTSAVLVLHPKVYNSTITPLRAVNRRKSILGKVASKEQLHALEAIRRLLLQVEAARAVSWVWPTLVPAIAHKRTNKKASTIESPLRRMLPTLRLRATRQLVPLAALSRCSKKL